MRRSPLLLLASLASLGIVPIACAEMSNLAHQAESAATSAAQQVEHKVENMTVLAYQMSFERFDPATSSFAPLPLPPKRNLFWTFGTNGKIVVLGGIDEKTHGIDAVDVFDIASSTWKTGASYPHLGGGRSEAAVDGGTSRDCVSVCAVPRVVGRFICFFDDRQYGPDTVCYDSAADSFAAHPEFPHVGGDDDWSRADWRSGGFTYVPGSKSPRDGGNGAVSVYDETKSTWTALPDPPAPIAFELVASVGGKLYAVSVPPGSADAGAADAGVPWGPTLVYDPHTNAWSEGKPLPPAVKAHYVMATNDHVYLFDNLPDGNGWIATAIYDPAKGEWAVPPAATASLHTKSLFGDGMAGDDKVFAFLLAEALAAKNSGRVWAMGPDGAWSTVAQHPTPPNAATLLYDGAAVDGRMYIVGVSTMIAPH